MPEEIRDLIRVSSGLRVPATIDGGRHAPPRDAVSFTRVGDVEFGSAIPSLVVLLADGAGNFWVVDVCDDGSCGAVFFVCHDLR